MAAYGDETISQQPVRGGGVMLSRSGAGEDADTDLSGVALSERSGVGSLWSAPRTNTWLYVGWYGDG
jgi:hypothetical protein